MNIDIAIIGNVDYDIKCVRSSAKRKCMSYLISIVEHKIPSV